MRRRVAAPHQLRDGRPDRGDCGAKPGGWIAWEASWQWSLDEDALVMTRTTAAAGWSQDGVPAMLMML